MNASRPNMKFDIGQLVTTNGIQSMADGNPEFVSFVVKSFGRYLNCDWGDMYEDDLLMNEEAVKGGARILGVYEHPDHPNWKIWIITEWDRSVTTILFPGEY